MVEGRRRGIFGELRLIEMARFNGGWSKENKGDSMPRRQRVSRFFMP